jgi:hypothetical protein
VLFAGAGVLTAAVPILVGMVTVPAILAQPAQSEAALTPKFEVASIRKCEPDQATVPGDRGGAESQ